MTDFTIVRSGRRSIALEITRDGKVLVRAPYRAPKGELEALVERRRDWIEAHLTRQLARPAPPTDAETAALRARAKAVLPGRVEFWSRQMGLTPTGVKITSARTRYGSCSARNSLCFSCYLLECPPEAVDLVVVHELCHIRHKNHGAQFYALLASVLPDWQARKRLLTMR